jgi:predicted TIM-barrel fold metal-dependent hydrolase
MAVDDFVGLLAPVPIKFFCFWGPIDYSKPRFVKFRSELIDGLHRLPNLSVIMMHLGEDDDALFHKSKFAHWVVETPKYSYPAIDYWKRAGGRDRWDRTLLFLVASLLLGTGKR